MPMAMNVITLASDRTDPRLSPQTPWPLVQPLAMRVPKPTSKPATTRPPVPATGCDAGKGATSCQTHGATKSPATKSRRVRSAAIGLFVISARKGLASSDVMPAMRPLPSTKIPLARPISRPPARALQGVKWVQSICMGCC